MIFFIECSQKQEACIYAISNASVSDSLLKLRNIWPGKNHDSTWKLLNLLTLVQIPMTLNSDTSVSALLLIVQHARAASNRASAKGPSPHTVSRDNLTVFRALQSDDTWQNDVRARGKSFYQRMFPKVSFKKSDSLNLSSDDGALWRNEELKVVHPIIGNLDRYHTKNIYRNRYQETTHRWQTHSSEVIGQNQNKN